MSDVASRLADPSLVVVSPVWGVLRPSDRIPPYRVHICARLVGMGRLEPAWRTALPGVLTAAKGPTDVVVDLRSANVKAMATPKDSPDSMRLPLAGPMTPSQRYG